MLKNINIKSKITLLVLGIIIMCLVMVGASYAYFSVNVEGTGNVTVIESGTLALKLVDGDAIALDNAIPGSKLTKTFSVTNTGTLDTPYDIYFSEVLNTFADKTDLVYTLTSSNSTCTTTAETEIPSKASKLIDACNIKSGKTQNFTLTIKFKETNDSQDDNQGKKFQTRISINEYKNIALLDTGVNFNTALKTLAGDTYADYSTRDTNITKIARVTSLPDGVTTSLVSVSDSSMPVYAYYDAGTINLYSEADSYYLNEDASEMYMNMTKLADVNLSIMDSRLSTNLASMFYNCSSLTSLDLSNFDTSNVTKMSEIFKNNTALKTLILDNWDVSKASIYDAFSDDPALESISMKNWKIGDSLTNFFGGASGNTTTASLDVTDWNLSQTTNLQGLFMNCKTNNIIGLNTWNTSNVIKLSQLFDGITGLQSLNLSSWDTSNVTDMSYMFNESKNLTEINISNFIINDNAMGYSMFKYSDIKSIIAQNCTFNNPKEFLAHITSVENVDLTNSKLIGNCTWAFYMASGIKSINLTNVDTSEATNMNAMFRECSSLESLNLSSFDTSNVTNMTFMFAYDALLTSLDLSNFNTDNVTSFNNMFYGITNLKTLILDNWNVRNATTNLSALFYEDSNLEKISTKNWKVKELYEGFFGKSNGNTSTAIIDVSNWDLTQATSLSRIFYSSNTSEIIGLDTWDTSNVTDMSNLFSYMTGIQFLDLSSFDTSKVTNMGDMFNGDTNLKTITVSDKFVTTAIDKSSTYKYTGVFTNCTSLVGGNGTVFNSSNTDYTYARVDTSSTPGYFTLKS